MALEYKSILKRVKISEVAESLDRIQRESLETEGVQVKYNLNFIVPVTSKEAGSAFKEIFESLAAFHPCRYFLIEVSDEIESLEAEIGVYETDSARGVKSTSELVRVKASYESLKALPSIIRAQRAEGLSTELLLIDKDLPQSSLGLFLPLVDKLIFDSRTINADETLLNGLLIQNLKLVDVKWAALSPWREQLREAFDRRILQNMLPHIKRVKICRNASRAQSSRAVPLTAGWIMHSLSCSLSSLGARGFECVFEDGRTLLLDLDTKVESPGYEGIVSIYLEFDMGSSKPVLSICYANGVLETSLDLDDQLMVHRKVSEEDSLVDVLKRVFTVGESMENYRDALKLALELGSLRRMYRG